MLAGVVIAIELNDLELSSTVIMIAHVFVSLPPVAVIVITAEPATPLLVIVTDALSFATTQFAFGITEVFPEEAVTVVGDVSKS